MSDRLQALLDSLSLPRRKLLPAALLGAGSLSTLLSSEVANADQAFTGFAFNASGNSGAAQRTDPDRWADVVNVLDFGALADGTNAGATTTAINNAIAAAAAKGSTALTGTKGGTVFFPPGSYSINAPLINTATVASVRLVGSGMWCTRLRGTVNGFIIDGTGAGSSTSGIMAVEDISVYNDQTSTGFDLTIGAIRIGAVGATINVLLKNIQFKGWTGIMQVYPSAQNDTNFETTLINCASTGFGSDSWNVIPTIPYITGPIGFYVAGCTMICCQASAYAVDMWFAGTDTVSVRGRTETAAIGVVTGITPRFEPDTVAGVTWAAVSGPLPDRAIITSTTPLANFGWTINGQTQSIIVQGVTPSGYNTTAITATRTGANTFYYPLTPNPGAGSGGTWTQLSTSVSADANVIMGHSTERCDTGMFLSHTGVLALDSAIITGTAGPLHNANSITWTADSPNFATVTSTTPLANFAVDGNGTPWTSGNPTQQVLIQLSNVGGYNTAGFVTATRTGANTFTYPLATNPGSSATSATWSFQCAFGLRIRNSSFTTLRSVSVSVSPVIVAGIDLYVDGLCSASHIAFMSTTAGLGGWIAPPASIKAAFQFFNCDQPGGTTLDVAARTWGMNFADLPGQPGVSLTPAIPGMQYDIVNGRKLTGLVPLTGTDLGATVTGGGTQYVLVRYNGTNWTCSGF